MMNVSVVPSVVRIFHTDYGYKLAFDEALNVPVGELELESGSWRFSQGVIGDIECWMAGAAIAALGARKVVFFTNETTVMTVVSGSFEEGVTTPDELPTDSMVECVRMAYPYIEVRIPYYRDALDS